ncbi:MAG: putative bifunctional diguanylate cyclase/phosphodiesterase [Cellulomonas sp.]
MKATWLRYLIVGVLVTVGDLLLAPGLVRDALYCVVAASGALAIVVGVRLHRPARPIAWYLIAAGITAWVVGGGQYAWFGRMTPVVAFPSIADAFYLATYPLVAAGLLMFARSRGAERRPTALLDSLIMTIGVGLISWVFLIEPSWETAQEGLFGRIVNSAYPLGNVLLFGSLVRLAMAPGAGRTVSRVFAGLVGAMLAAMSLVQASTVVPIIDVHPSALDPRWLVGYVLAGAAALHPTMRAFTTPAAVRSETLRAWQVAGLASALLIGPAILGGELILGTPLHAGPVVIASAGLVLLVQLRMFRLVRRVEDDATTDQLTGLPNRRALYLQGDLRLADVKGRRQALLMLDLDRFKEVNDSLGHQVGDQLLIQVGARLGARLRVGDLLVRLGGDEFAILLQDAGHDEAVLVAQSLRAALTDAFTIGDIAVDSAASIGIALFPDDGEDLSTLLRKADIAMYKSKASGQAHAYSAEDDGAARLLMVEELRTALTSHQLLLHYQPKIDLRTGEVHGVEALVRWAHPVHGLLYPDRFLDLVEEAGLMRAMTRAVLHLALDQLVVWSAAGRPLKVAVNLSASSLVDVDLPAEVAAMLAARSLPASALQLEITEEFLMADRERARAILTRLRADGIEIAVDDFGTGYSSLAYLRELPIDELKLDRSFILPMADDARAAALVASTIDLAHSLDLRMVAEGVENAAVLAQLTRLGCDQAQGYYMSRPLPAAGLDRWLLTKEQDGAHSAADVRTFRPAVSMLASDRDGMASRPSRP